MSPQNSKKAKPHSLESVVRRELGIELDKEHQTADWAGDLSPAMLEYAAMDTQVLLPLVEVFNSEIEDTGLKRASEIEHRALPAISWMATTGLPFDATGWREHLKELEDEKRRLTKELDRLAPERPGGKTWNWNSHLQVKEAFGLLGLSLPNTQEDTLSRYDHRLAKALLAYKRVSTMLGSYGPKLLGFVGEDGRIRGDWHQIGAETGRMSCSKPALQQLNPEVKGYVRAPDGRVLVKADYSQIELRIAAKISGDERMLEAYQKGEDLHLLTAKSLASVGVGKEDRKLAKAVNFGLLYGQGVKGFREFARDKYETDITLEEAALYKRRFFETYPGLAAFTEWVNAPVQGTGADGLKLALALLWERQSECPGAVPVACVHDEILVECDERDAEKAEAWLKKAMVDGMDEVLNGLKSEGAHVTVGVETQTANTWAG